VTATDAAGNVSVASAALALTIDTIAPVVTDSNAAANVLNIGTMKNGDLVGLTASGAGTGGTYSLVSNPDNLFSINSATGVVTLVNGAALTLGAHAVAVQGVDVAGNIGTGNFTVFGDTPPTISGIANTTFAEDHQSPMLSFTIGDAETPAANLTLSATSSNGLIGGFTFGGSGANRTLIMTPGADNYGTTTITVTVKDSEGLTSSSGFVATVTPVDDPTTAITDIYGTTEHGAVTIAASQLTDNDSDADAVAAVQSVSAVSGGGVKLVGGNVVFTPATGAHGLGHYTYTDTDNSTANVWVKLAPIAGDADYIYEIQQMYIGYFGRAADQKGLSDAAAALQTWMGQGKTASEALTSLGSLFTHAPEYSNIGSNAQLHTSWTLLDDTGIVQQIYQNLFNRAARDDEAAHWVGFLTAGTLTKESLVWTIGQSIQPGDLPVSQDVVYAAQYLTDHMTALENAYYVGDGASDVARTYLNTVVDDRTLAVAADNIKSYIDALVAAGKSAKAAPLADNLMHGHDQGQALTLIGIAAQGGHDIM
jgi:hypothetical protein